MSAASNYLENKLLDHVLTATSFSQPSRFLALFTGTASTVKANLDSGTLTDGNRNRKVQAEKQWSKLNNEEREMAISYARKTKQMNKPPSYVMSPDKMLKDKEFIGEPHMHVEKRGISGIVGVDRAMKDEQDRYYSRQSKQEVIDFINLRKEKDIKSFTTYEYTCKTYGLEQRFKDAHYFYHGNPY
jgi:hypothetical protein